MIACKEDERPFVDKELPKIEIYSPQKDFFYKQGDTVFIKAYITDNSFLRKGSVHIHDQFLPVGQDTVFVYEFSVKDKVVELDTFWKVNDAADKNYTIYFDAVDQSENLTEKLEDFYQYH
jgi:hypothetical protein